MKAKLPLSLVLTLFAGSALAEPTSEPGSQTPKQQAAELVTRNLLQPLEKHQRSRKKFSRAAPPAQRRVRVTDREVLVDARGQRFMRFAIDAHFPWQEDEEWDAAVIVGCVELDTRAVFVHLNDADYPAAVMLGKNAKPKKGVCEAAEAPVGERADG